MNKTGVILLNLGTPDEPTPQAVKRYLREFLMDPYVVDMPFFPRALLVHGVILQTRPKKSAHAYQQIWTGQGSPLFVHHLKLVDKVKNLLTEGFVVVPAMRYGNPSVSGALQVLVKQGIRHIKVIPLFPQYSTAATESAIQKVKKEAKKFKNLHLKFLRDFYQVSEFIEAWSARVKDQVSQKNYDHVLFTFHGLPKRHLADTPGMKTVCGKSGCCIQMKNAEAGCYKAQCLLSAGLIAKSAGLALGSYSVAFQSRLGRSEWIEPYTEQELIKLAQSRKKQILIVAPSFVADCLETIEEIGIRGRETFLAAGGEKVDLIPSLNSDEDWAKAILKWITQGELLRWV